VLHNVSKLFISCAARPRGARDWDAGKSEFRAELPPPPPPLPPPQRAERSSRQEAPVYQPPRRDWCAASPAFGPALTHEGNNSHMAYFDSNSVIQQRLRASKSSNESKYLTGSGSCLQSEKFAPRTDSPKHNIPIRNRFLSGHQASILLMRSWRQSQVHRVASCQKLER
jgi:hypothetical protein